MSNDNAVTEANGDVSQYDVRALLERRAWVSVHAEQFPVTVLEDLGRRASDSGARLIIRDASRILQMRRERIAEKAQGAVTFEF
jgi:hypothetical protein